MRKACPRANPVSKMMQRWYMDLIQTVPIKHADLILLESTWSDLVGMWWDLDLELPGRWAWRDASLGIPGPELKHGNMAQSTTTELQKTEHHRAPQSYQYRMHHMLQPQSAVSVPALAWATSVANSRVLCLVEPRKWQAATRWTKQEGMTRVLHGHTSFWKPVSISHL
jgi:hypothetical protein